jgi:hypothetical protein
MVEIVGVEVVDGALLRARSHIDVEVSVVEADEHIRHHVPHQVLAHVAAGIGKTVGELIRLG